MYIHMYNVMCIVYMYTAPLPHCPDPVQASNPSTVEREGERERGREGERERGREGERERGREGERECIILKHRIQYILNYIVCIFC